MVLALLSPVVHASEALAESSGGFDYWAGWEDGTIASGQAVSLVESYSLNEDSDVVDSSGDFYEASELHSITIEEVDWAREGDHVAKFYADGRNHGTSQDYSRRAELATSPQALGFSPGDERYYTMSFLAPEESWDQENLYSVVISQWKQYGGGSPNAEIRLSNTGDYAITARSVRHWTSESDEGDIIGYAEPGEWTDVKYYVRHSEGSDGALKVWINGELAFEYSGKTLYKDEEGYIKFGMYTEIRDERTLYFDAVHIADSISTTLDEWAASQAHLPTASLTGPANDTHFGSAQPVTITADAADPAGRKIGTPGSITKVDFFEGGNLLGTDHSAPYELVWDGASDGPYTMSAVATDADGNTVTSDTREIYVGPKPPEIALTSPNALTDVSLGDPVSIEATATDPDGTVARVDFLVDGEVIASDTSAPYSTSWTPPGQGAYIVRAEAVDADGKFAVTAPAVVTAGAAFATTDLVSVQDAALREAAPTSPANWSRVEVRGKAGGSIAGLFQFDLSGLPAGHAVRESTLKLYPSDMESSGIEMTVYGAGNTAWDEDDVSWSTSPARGEALDTVLVANTGSYYDFDVSDFVVAQQGSGHSVANLRIEDPQLLQKAIEFDSWTRSNPPTLRVVSSDVAVPDVSDTDGDYVLDRDETTGCEALADCDGDGLGDYRDADDLDADQDKDGVHDGDEQALSCVTVADCDGDGAVDLVDPDDLDPDVLPQPSGDDTDDTDNGDDTDDGERAPGPEILPEDTRPADDQIVRLYRAVFNRLPDAEGLRYWSALYRSGWSLADIVDDLIASGEFGVNYGSNPSNGQLVDAMYANVLDRAGDPEGVAYWIGRLEGGMTVNELLRAFADSRENINGTGTSEPLTSVESKVLRLYRAVLGRTPDTDGLRYWTGRAESGISLQQIADAFAVSAESQARYGSNPTDSELIDNLYRNVLDRPGDPDGVAYWLKQRAAGMSKADLLLAFADSRENLDRTGTRP